MQIASHTVSDVTLRDTIHDLRNLFGVVASARHMLDDKPSSDRRMLLLDAIEDAALRGDRLTTAMLAQAAPDHGGTPVDLNAHLRGLEPLMRAHGNRQVEIRFEPCVGPLPVKLDIAGLDAAVLELIANACSALSGTGTILIRTRCRERRAQLVIADNGQGMSTAQLDRALNPREKPAANGTGLARIGHFALNAEGSLRIRSRKARGTVACVNLPLVPRITGVETAGTLAAVRHKSEKISDEKRCSIAA